MTQIPFSQWNNRQIPVPILPLQGPLLSKIQHTVWISEFFFGERNSIFGLTVPAWKMFAKFHKKETIIKVLNANVWNFYSTWLCSKQLSSMKDGILKFNRFWTLWKFSQEIPYLKLPLQHFWNFWSNAKCRWHYCCTDYYLQHNFFLGSCGASCQRGRFYCLTRRKWKCRWSCYIFFVTFKMWAIKVHSKPEMQSMTCEAASQPCKTS